MFEAHNHAYWAVSTAYWYTEKTCITSKFELQFQYSPHKVILHRLPNDMCAEHPNRHLYIKVRVTHWLIEFLDANVHSNSCFNSMFRMLLHFLSIVNHFYWIWVNADMFSKVPLVGSDFQENCCIDILNILFVILLTVSTWRGIFFVRYSEIPALLIDVQYQRPPWNVHMQSEGNIDKDWWN